MKAMTNNELWQTILGELEILVSRANFITWFKDTSIELRKKNQVIISVPNGFTKEWLENKYHKLILKAIQNFYPNIHQVQYIIGKTKSPILTKISKPTIITTPDLNILEKSSLNPRYTFENFVIGSSNELAQAASAAVAQNPGKAYNPLFIYGGVGLGKTHLLQSIGNEILNLDTSKKIQYVTSEKFTNELIEAIRHRATKDFKDKYRENDLLIIDDVQFIGGKETTQEEFFHTFNALYENNKQIVLSSDRPPKAIHTLEERLRSRFEGGMIADITLPNLETRLAILKNKLAEKKTSLPENVLEYIAANIQNNIRELEGALNKLIAHCHIQNKPIEFKQAVQILSGLVSRPSHKLVKPKDIVKIVSDFYGVTMKSLFDKGRKREIVKPRQIAMYLMRKETKSSYPSIGEELGKRDHTTAIHAFEKINKQVQNDETLEQEINLIKEKIYNN